MIRISVIGRLGQDATVNNVNGKNVINFSVAYSEKFKNQQGEDVDRTTWVSCAYWTEKFTVANYLKKGTLVYVEGKPEAKTYLNSKTNQTIPQLHSRVTSVQLLSSNQTPNEAPVQSDDMPF